MEVGGLPAPADGEPKGPSDRKQGYQDSLQPRPSWWGGEGKVSARTEQSRQGLCGCRRGPQAGPEGRDLA